LSATFTPADATDYATVTQSASINVDKAAPTITWANPADITYGTTLGAAQLDATADVPGTFAYTPAAGTVLSAGSGQTLSVTFTPSDATDYATATQSASINVDKAAAPSNSKPVPSNKPVASTTTLKTSATVAATSRSVAFTFIAGARLIEPILPVGTVTYRSEVLKTVKLSKESATDSTSKPIAGSHTITASYAGDTNFAPAMTTRAKTVNAKAIAPSRKSVPSLSAAGPVATFFLASEPSSATPISSGGAATNKAAASAVPSAVNDAALTSLMDDAQTAGKARPLFEL
jgi:hypothetical protein